MLLCWPQNREKFATETLSNWAIHECETCNKLQMGMEFKGRLETFRCCSTTKHARMTQNLANTPAA